MDKGGEYYSPCYFQEMGIVHENTTGYSPHSNGVAEGKIGHYKKWLTPCYPTQD